MPTPYQRVRVTSATLQRVQHFRNLIAGFKAGGMMFDQICAMLAMTPSGGRKYLRDLREAGVVHVVNHDSPRPPHFIGYQVFGLVSEALADEFLDKIALPANGRMVVPVKARDENPGVRTHIMGDDVRFEVKRPKFVAHRDELVSALFGPAVSA